jgi:hypothetical protein
MIIRVPILKNACVNYFSYGVISQFLNKIIKVEFGQIFVPKNTQQKKMYYANTKLE